MTTTEEKIKQVMINFVRGGDNSDVDLLDAVLHQNFRVCSNGFMGTMGVKVITKEQYLDYIRTGVFGGLPRQMSIESIEWSNTIASVKLRLESAENHFISYNALVIDTDNEWKLIHNLAVVEAK